MKKVVGVMVFMSLTLISFTGALAMDSQGDTIYVDDSGGADYIRIQNAVDNASSGDTIFVYSGVYMEHVTIDKPLTLIGEDNNSTVVDGGEDGDVVSITADNVTIVGFTIQNSGTCEYDFGIEIRSHNNTITDNLIKDNGGLHDDGWSRGGIYMVNVSYNDIGHNRIFANDREGIHLVGSNHNSIHDNHIYGNDYFAIIFDASSYNTVHHNDMFENYVCMSFWPYSTHNEIVGNRIHDHGYYSLSFYSLSDDNVVRYNNFTDNVEWSIRIAGANNNLVEYNSISGSSGGAWGYGYGILLEYAFHNTIRYNNIMNHDTSAMTNNSFANQWHNNYWDDYGEFGPRIVPGKITIPLPPFLSIPWPAFDWRPADEPHDIP